MGELIERLHNCPNCGGALQDNGRCRFCGSKVYDFVNIDMDSPTRTYIRMRYNGKIVLCPIMVDTFTINYSTNTMDADYYPRGVAVFNPPVIKTGSMEFMIMGDIIYEDAE